MKHLRILGVELEIGIDQKTYPLLTSVAIRQGKYIKELATEAIDAYIEAYLQQAVAEK